MENTSSNKTNRRIIDGGSNLSLACRQLL